MNGGYYGEAREWMRWIRRSIAGDPNQSLVVRQASISTSGDMVKISDRLPKLLPDGNPAAGPLFAQGGIKASKVPCLFANGRDSQVFVLNQRMVFRVR